MKRLFVLLIFISLKNGLSAQITDTTRTDSTRMNNMNNTMNNPSRMDSSSTNTVNAYNDSVNNASTNATTNNSMNNPSDSTGSMNNSTNNMNNNSMNTTTDTTGATNNMNNNSTNNMNNNSVNSTTDTTMNSMNNNSMNNNSMSNMNSNGMNSSIAGVKSYAALPVMESYVPDDIVSKIKSKYGNGTVIYDITAVRAALPQDSSMTQQNGTMSSDSSMNNTSMNNNTSVNNGSMNNTTMNNGDSTMTGNMMQNSSVAATPKYNYLVRTLSNGTLQSEWVGDDGTTTVTPGEMNIRDLIKSKKVLHQYLLLQIGSNEIHMYFNDSGKMERIFSSNLRAISKIPVPFWTQSGMADSRRTEENDNVKSLRKVDNTLDHILASYSLPFFVTGKKKVIDEFRQITKHTYAITEYAPHTSDDPDKEELKKIIAPYVADWEKINQKRLMGLVYRATEKHKLVSGIVDVYKTTKYNNGKLLLVEEDYVYPDTYTESDEMIYQATKSYSPYSYLKDAVDEAIEKVLEEDGDVGYMQKGALANYEHITLIQ